MAARQPLSASAPHFSAETHVVLLDWHSVETSNGAACTTARLRLRDAVLRFLQLLFHSSSQLRHSLLLLSTCGHDQQHVPRVVPLLELAALKHTSIATAMHALRTAQLQAKPLHSAFVPEYCRSLVAQLSHCAAACSSSAAPHVYIFCSQCISSALSSALLAAKPPVFTVHKCHLFPCTLTSSADAHLAEIVARLLQGSVTLTLPNDASPSLQLTLCARPRVLTATVQYPSALVATRRVTLSSMREDMLHGTPMVLWPAMQSPRQVQQVATFERVVRMLAHCREALLCVAPAENGQKLFALVPPSNGSGIALLREAAHAHNMLPLPKRTTACAAHTAAHNGEHHRDETETGLELLPSEAFRAHCLRVGGLRLRAGAVNARRRVNFGGETSQ